MKKYIALFFALLLTCCCGLALAEEPLEAEEVRAFCGRALAYALTLEPVEAEDIGSGFYSFVFDGVALVCTGDTLTEDSDVVYAEVYGGEETLCDARGIVPGSLFEDALAAYPLDNPGLTGAYDEAALYISGVLPDPVRCGILARDGSRPAAIQHSLYTVDGDAAEVWSVGFLFEDGALQKAVTDKVFLGFSDTTLNHLMLHKVGLKTFYGQAFLSDLCEIGPEMPAYSRAFFEELISTGGIRQVRPSSVWYEERKDYGPSQVGTPLVSHPDRGFERLQGPSAFSGKILGGCIDSLHDIFDGERYADMPVLCERYHLFPDAEDWKGRILLLETSEEKPSPEKYRKALRYLKGRGVFDAVSGVLAGKPMDEAFAEEYKQILTEEIARPQLPVVFNLNIGHAQPRCILPFGVEAHVDTDEQIIRF